VTNDSAFVYFSFITLTTVGYGDLSPTPGLPRTMALSEELIGQIFLVILVARLVAADNPKSWQDPRRTLLVQERAAKGRSASLRIPIQPGMRWNEVPAGTRPCAPCDRVFEAPKPLCGLRVMPCRFQPVNRVYGED
jgi:hypothetical protein